MANRNRPIQVKFRVTPEERLLIDKRMETSWHHEHGGVSSQNGNRRICGKTGIAGTS